MSGAMNDTTTSLSTGSLTDSHDETRWTRVFWMLLVAHIFVWTAVPSLTASNHTLDGIEMATWGREWQLGYYKHPPLPAWIARVLTQTFGSHPASLYFAAAAASGTCLWAAFALGRRMMGPAVGLTAAVSLEVVHYFTLTSIEFNNNIVSRAFAAVAVVCLHRAVSVGVQSSGKSRDWILAGVMLGLAMLAKYDVAVLAVVLLTYSVVRTEPRRHWRTSGPYLMLASSLIVFAPHFAWLWANDFPTLAYVAKRSQPATGWLDHITRPVSFAASQLAAIGPVYGLLAWACWRRSGETTVDQQKLKSEDAVFSQTVVWGVFATILIGAVISGSGVRSMWGSSLWTFLGLAMLVIILADERFQLTRLAVVRATRGGAIVGFSLALVVWGRHSYGPEIRGKLSRVHYPGAALAVEIERAWDAASDKPLPQIAGDRWLASNVSLMGEDDASIYIEGDASKSRWTSDTSFAATGGVIIWRGEQPTELLERFPHAGPVTRLELTNERHPGIAVPEVSYSILPPAAVVAEAPSATRIR